jgi:hypothetical protein
VAYLLRKPRRNGATHLVRTPVQRLARVSALISLALCEGAKLHVTVPDEAGPHDVAVKVYLVRPREDDIR